MPKIQSIDTKLVESAIRKIAYKVIAERKVTNKKISEAAMGLNLSQPYSNLFIKGWGMDKNGNMRIVVGFPNDKGFPIQTNGVLKDTHRILQTAHKQLSENELDVIGREVTDYVKKFGPAMVRSRLKVYGKSK